MTALTFGSIGTEVANTTGNVLSPGAPSTKAVGNLLLAFTGQRTVGATCTLSSSANAWRLLAPQLQDTTMPPQHIYARIADGSADDTPTFDWSGAQGCTAVISAWSGDVYSGDLRTLVVNAAPQLFVAASTITLPPMTVTGNDRLVIVFGMKNKTAAADGATVTPPAGYTLRSGQVPAGNNQAICVATQQQTTPVDFDGTDATVSGTAESLTSTGLVIAIRTGSADVSTIIPDAVSESIHTDTTSPVTWSHPGGADANAAVLKITHNTSLTDHVTAAPTYGGVAMTRQQRNTDSTTEPGAAEIWTLLASVPTGSQTVSYAPGATTDDFHAVLETYVSPQPLTVVDVDGVSDNVANPSVTLTTGGKHCIATGILFTGLDAPSGFAENADCIRVARYDYGTQNSIAFRSMTSGTADKILGGTAGTDDVAFSGVLLGYTPATAGIVRQMMQYHG